MKCSNCNSNQTVKNGQRKGRQCYKCKQCGRQFLEYYYPWRYSDDVKQLCIKMYLNGMGLRGIERVTDIHHTTVMNWVREAGLRLPDTPELEEEPEITDLDELQTFVGNKRHKIWLWTAVNHWQPGIIAWTIGDRSSLTFQLLWVVVKCWQSFWYVTDGYAVYPKYNASLEGYGNQTAFVRVSLGTHFAITLATDFVVQLKGWA